MKILGCQHCKTSGPDPGWIEQDNNGPIVACPICNKDGEYDRAWGLAEEQRAAQYDPASRWEGWPEPPRDR